MYAFVFVAANVYLYAMRVAMRRLAVAIVRTIVFNGG
jgi:hypothetical protein